MDGCVGAHIIANSEGYSRDRSISLAMQLGGKYAVVVNDPLLSEMLLSLGITPLYRVKNADFDDDNAHQHFPARDYIRKLSSEAPRGAILYPINEPGDQDLARLNQWMLDAVDEANKLGRKVIGYNWSYRNPRPAAWDTLTPSARALAAGGHFFGVHEGYDTEFPTLPKARPECIGRFLPAKQRFGGKWIVTEFAASKTPHDGWRAWLSWQQWASLVYDAVRDVYAPNGVYVTPFSVFPWMRDFDYVNEPELRNAFNEINQRIPVVTTPTAPPVNIPSDPGDGTPMRVRTVGLRLRTDHSTTAAAVRTLTASEPVTVYMETVTALIDKYSWAYLTTAKDKGWAAIRGAWGESFTPLDAPKLELIMPVGCDIVITSKFGVPRDYDGDGILDDKHEGLDVAPAHKNCTPLILAGADGVVDEVSSAGSYGIHIKVRHVLSAATFVTWYCHLQKALVKAGDTVKQGDFIGVMGSTGNSTGTHLHLNVQHLGHGLTGFVIPDAVDPLSYIEETDTLSLVA